MSNVETKDLNIISSDILQKHNIKEEELNKIAELLDSDLTGSKSFFMMIKIKNGQGNGSATKTTLNKTLDGNGKITDNPPKKSPREGTWHLIAKVDGKEVFNETGVKFDQPLNFKGIKTKFKSKFEIFATWSEKRNTDLYIKLKVHW